MLKYDDAAWHYDGEFPPDLLPQNGATHIALFLFWAIERELASNFHLQTQAALLEQVRQNVVSYRDYFLQVCDGILTEDDFNPTGKAFADDYYDDEYLEDYDKLLCPDPDSFYYVEDSWENFEQLGNLLDERFAEWQSLEG